MFQVRQLFLLGIFFLIQLSDQLPVKEPKSTEKDPNKHEEGDSPTHNLENVIGKLFVSIWNGRFHVFSIISLRI